MRCHEPIGQRFCRLIGSIGNGRKARNVGLCDTVGGVFDQMAGDTKFACKGLSVLGVGHCQFLLVRLYSQLVFLSITGYGPAEQNHDRGRERADLRTSREIVYRAGAVDCWLCHFSRVQGRAPVLSQVTPTSISTHSSLAQDLEQMIHLYSSHGVDPVQRG